MSCCTYHCTDAPGCPVHRQRGPDKKLALNTADAHLALASDDSTQATRQQWAAVLAPSQPARQPRPAKPSRRLGKPPGQLFWFTVAGVWMVLSGVAARLLFGG